MKNKHLLSFSDYINEAATSAKLNYKKKSGMVSITVTASGNEVEIDPSVGDFGGYPEVVSMDDFKDSNINDAKVTATLTKVESELSKVLSPSGDIKSEDVEKLQAACDSADTNLFAAETHNGFNYEQNEDESEAYNVCLVAIYIIAKCEYYLYLKKGGLI